MEVGPAEVRPVECRPVECCLAKVRPVEDRLLEGCPAEVRLAENIRRHKGRDRRARKPRYAAKQPRLALDQPESASYGAARLLGGKIRFHVMRFGTVVDHQVFDPAAELAA